MTWQRGQYGNSHNGPPLRQASPLGPMSAAAMAASNRPLLEQTLKQALHNIDQIPADIDFMAFQSGLARYTANTSPRQTQSYPVIATSGRVTLLDAGATNPKNPGPPVVIVPSMVNKGYVLDLHPGFSLTEHLRNSGFHVLLIDWGTPDPTNAQTLSSIITTGLEPLLQTAVQQFGPISLFGYCMGGLLALAATVRLNIEALNTKHQSPITKLAVAAMPWDFSATTSAQHMQWARPLLEPYLGASGIIPPETIAHYFWSLDPWSPIRRLMAYGRETDPARLAHLTALEDWLHDGLPLDGPIAKEMLFGWYTENTPLKGLWTVGNTPILPANINCPLWVCITQNDLLVPTASSLPFIGQTKNAQVVMSDTGHVGLVCGRRAKERLYDPLTAWLKS